MARSRRLTAAELEQERLALQAELAGLPSELQEALALAVSEMLLSPSQQAAYLAAEGYLLAAAPAKPQPALPPDPNSPTLHLGLGLLETADPYLLHELRADAKLASMLGETVSEQALLVAAGKEDALQKQLLKSGHTPRVARDVEAGAVRTSRR